MCRLSILASVQNSTMISLRVEHRQHVLSQSSTSVLFHRTREERPPTRSRRRRVRGEHASAAASGPRSIARAHRASTRLARGGERGAGRLSMERHARHYCVAATHSSDMDARCPARCLSRHGRGRCRDRGFARAPFRATVIADRWRSLHPTRCFPPAHLPLTTHAPRVRRALLW